MTCKVDIYTQTMLNFRLNCRLLQKECHLRQQNVQSVKINVIIIFKYLHKHMMFGIDRM